MPGGAPEVPKGATERTADGVRLGEVTGLTALFAAIVAFADRLLRPVEVAAATLGGAMMVTAMLLTTMDALMRYAFNSPLNFNYFVTENYLLVGLVCLPMAWGFRRGDFIRISFLTFMLPKAAGNILLRLGLVASALFCADLAWLGGRNWYEVYSSGKVEIEVINFPWHLSWIWVPIGLGLLTLRLLLTALGPDAQLNTAHTSEEAAV